MFWNRKKKQSKSADQIENYDLVGNFLDQMKSSGLGPSDYNSEGSTLLHKVAAKGVVNSLQAMLQHGADPMLPCRAKTHLGWTPLHFAAVGGHADAIELLISHGAKVDALCEELNTPLHIAAYQGHEGAIRTLLIHGSDLSLRDDSAKNALDYAIQEGHSQLVPLLGGAAESDESKVERLGYSLTAMLEIAKRNGVIEDESTIPIIPEVVPLFEKAKLHFLKFITCQDSRYFETLMHHTCRYFWGKGIEASLLWAKSINGKITLNFETSEMVNQTIVTDLPVDIDAIVKREIDGFLPYFKAHQDAMMQHQSNMSPDRQMLESIVTLDHLPLIAMAHAIRKGYNVLKW